MFFPYRLPLADVILILIIKFNQYQYLYHYFLYECMKDFLI